MSFPSLDEYSRCVVQFPYQLNLIPRYGVRKIPGVIYDKAVDLATDCDIPFAYMLGLFKFRT